MSSVQPIASSTLTAPPPPVRREEAAIPAAFTTPRADRPEHVPAVPEALDIKNIRRANAYADAFGMAVDPTKDISLEGAASLFARYDKAVTNVIDRICKAKFTILLDMKV